jgi:hypothetical protein
MEWDISNVLKSVFGKIVEVSFNDNGPKADLYLKNLLTPLIEYIYRFFDVIDAKQVLPRDHKMYTQFMKCIADIFVAVEAYLSGVLDREKMIDLLKKTEKILLTSDATTLFLGS